jgi:hypothetical protein
MENETKDEQYYLFVFYLFVTLMGLFVQTEVKTSAGRADAVVKRRTRFMFLSSRWRITTLPFVGTETPAMRKLSVTGWG